MPQRAVGRLYGRRWVGRASAITVDWQGPQWGVPGVTHAVCLVAAAPALGPTNRMRSLPMQVTGGARAAQGWCWLPRVRGLRQISYAFSWCQPTGAFGKAW